MVSSPRRVRLLLFTFLLFSVLLFFRSSITLPDYLKDIDAFAHFSSNTPKDLPVDEIYGLLHVVTGAQDPALVLNEDVDWNMKPKDMKIYTGGKSVDWAAEKKRIDALYPVVVFSKTYCPFSRKAKGLLETYGLSPAPKVVELDNRPDAHLIKSVLTRLTGLSTVPNTLVHGKSLGGSDSLQNLDDEGTLGDKLRVQAH